MRVCSSRHFGGYLIHPRTCPNAAFVQNLWYGTENTGPRSRERNVPGAEKVWILKMSLFRDNSTVKVEIPFSTCPSSVS